MASKQPPTSPGSDNDERKRKRKLSNRESISPTSPGSDNDERKRKRKLSNRESASPTSTGSDNDERKRKRKLSNRESARRSRMRKRQQLDELMTQENKVKDENKKLEQMIDGASQLYLNFASDNNVLRAQVAELTDRLRSLNSVLQIASEVSGLAFDIPDIPDALLEPWQLPCPIQPIPASVDMFEH